MSNQFATTLSHVFISNVSFLENGHTNPTLYKSHLSHLQNHKASSLSSLNSIAIFPTNIISCIYYSNYWFSSNVITLISRNNNRIQLFFANYRTFFIITCTFSDAVLEIIIADIWPLEFLYLRSSKEVRNYRL